MKRLLAVWSTKILILVGKLLGKKGSSAPGKIALKICPQILRVLSGEVRDKIIVVCGNNGKTTTNNLIYHLIKSTGKEVVCNRVGANMLPGIVTAFVSKCDVFGKFNTDYACLEIDEASTVQIFDHIKPDYMIITNLFRDQMDRYGETEQTLEYIKKALLKSPKTKLILNSDDPLLSSLGNDGSVYFGISEVVTTSSTEATEGRFCPLCGNELSYNFYHYSQLGDYCCEKCGFKRPSPNFYAENISLDDGLHFTIDGIDFSLKIKGFYNIYNVLSAFSAVKLSGLEVTDINSVINNSKLQVGRMEEFFIKNKKVVLNLAKNPAGFNQAISTVVSDTRKKSVVVAVNDMPSDGRDITWIWDVNFDELKNTDYDYIGVSGNRHNDLAVRFKYAEISSVENSPQIKELIQNALESDCEVVYILVNYTMLFSTQKLLKDMEGVK